MRRSRLVVAAASFAVAAMVGASTGAHPAVAEDAPGTGPEAPVETGTAAVDAVADQVWEIAAPYASFAGENVDAANGTVSVFTQGVDLGLRDALLSRLSVSQVTIVPGMTMNIGTLDEVSARVGQDSDWFSSQGYELVRWGPDFTTNTVSIGLGNFSPEAAAAITSRYGASVVTVVPDSEYVLTASRLADSAPWYGGDRIYPAGRTGPCTLGPGVITANNVDYTITAGHCGGLNTQWVNNGSTVGYAINVKYYNGAVGDVELVNGRGSYYSWGGSTVHPVKNSALRDYAGDRICASGSYSGQVCNNIVDYVNQCIKFAETTITTCGLTVAHNPDGKVPARDGDSGGPVFNYYSNGNELNMRGIITGASRCLCQVVYTTSYNIYKLLNVRIQTETLH